MNEYINTCTYFFFFFRKKCCFKEKRSMESSDPDVNKNWYEELINNRFIEFIDKSKKKWKEGERAALTLDIKIQASSDVWKAESLDAPSL